MKKLLFILSATAVLFNLGSCELEQVQPTDKQSSPVASFNFEIIDRSCSSDCEVKFTNTSQNADTYEWDFGDGSGKSTEESPTYVYDNLGTFQVKLIATVLGDTNEVTKAITLFLVDSRDGKQYATVWIDEQGSNDRSKPGQLWMQENLDYSSPSNSRCYNGNLSNCNTYGRLYNWHDIMDGKNIPGSQGVCPNGWHVPTDYEWKILEQNLGMEKSEADKTKWRGTDEGSELRQGGTSGFEALLGGLEKGDEFHNGEITGYFWTSSWTNQLPVHRYVSSTQNGIGRDDADFELDEGTKMSCRCIKDE